MPSYRSERALLFLLALVANTFVFHNFTPHASAEEKSQFVLPIATFRNLEQSGIQTLGAADTELSVQLPGYSPKTALFIRNETKREQKIKVLGHSNEVLSVESVSVFDVTDYRNIEGVAVVSRDGIQGLIADRSGAEDLYWEFSPGSLRTNTGIAHDLTLVRESELPEQRSLSHDMRSVPLMAAPNPKIPSSQNVIQASGQRTIQLVGVSPSVFTNGRGNDQIAAHLASIVAGANAFFVPLDLVINLVAVEVYSNSAQDPYFNSQISQNAEGMLTKLQSQWGSRSSPQHDIAAVFGRGIFQGILGVAYFQASCVFSQFSLLFTTLMDESASSSVAVAATLAHETGHVIGMDHDTNLYSGRPSLMFPAYSPDVAGFSSFSVSQYLNWAGPGKAGGACFQGASSGGGDGDDDGGGGGDDPGSGGGSGGGGGGVETGNLLTFVGGADQKLTLKEGESLEHVIRVVGEPAGLTLSVAGLPAGATFDSATGVLNFTPGFSIATRRSPSKQFRLIVSAQAPSASGIGMLRIVVNDLNRAPFFTEPLGNTVEAHPGETVDLKVKAQDFDQGDRATVELQSLDKVKKRLGKSATITQKDSTVRVRWRVPLNTVGDFPLRFRAVDLSGKKTVKNITIQVNP